MTRIFKIADTGVELLITFIILLFLTKYGILNASEDTTDLVFYVLPLVVAVIKNLKFVKNNVKRLIAFIKSITSKSSMYWEFVAEYTSDCEIDTCDISKIIDMHNLENHYKNFTKS